MTAAPGPEVEIWSMGEIASFHPQLTLTSSAPVADVLTLLEAGLRDAHFKVKERRSTGFRARYVDWVSLVSGNINWTSVEVDVATEGTQTQVLVTGGFEGTDRNGRKRAARGLSTAVTALRQRGHEVATTPWRARDDVR